MRVRACVCVGQINPLYIVHIDLDYLISTICARKRAQTALNLANLIGERGDRRAVPSCKSIHTHTHAHSFSFFFLSICLPPSLPRSLSLFNLCS